MANGIKIEFSHLKLFVSLCVGLQVATYLLHHRKCIENMIFAAGVFIRGEAFLLLHAFDNKLASQDEEVFIPLDDAPQCLTFSRDGSILAVECNSGAVQLLKVEGFNKPDSQNSIASLTVSFLPASATANLHPIRYSGILLFLNDYLLTNGYNLFPLNEMHQFGQPQLLDWQTCSVSDALISKTGVPLDVWTKRKQDALQALQNNNVSVFCAVAVRSFGDTHIFGCDFGLAIIEKTGHVMTLYVTSHPVENLVLTDQSLIYCDETGASNALLKLSESGNLCLAATDKLGTEVDIAVPQKYPDCT